MRLGAAGWTIAIRSCTAKSSGSIATSETEHVTFSSAASPAVPPSTTAPVSSGCSLGPLSFVSLDAFSNFFSQVAPMRAKAGCQGATWQKKFKKASKEANLKGPTLHPTRWKTGAVVEARLAKKRMRTWKCVAIVLALLLCCRRFMAICGLCAAAPTCSPATLGPANPLERNSSAHALWFQFLPVPLLQAKTKAASVEAMQGPSNPMHLHAQPPTTLRTCWPAGQGPCLAALLALLRSLRTPNPASSTSTRLPRTLVQLFFWFGYLQGTPSGRGVVPHPPPREGNGTALPKPKSTLLPRPSHCQQPVTFMQWLKPT